MIVIDDRENPKRVETFIKYFEDKNYHVKVGHLEIGDITLYKNNYPTTCVEYKTCHDFISSIIDNRLFNQVRDMSESFPKHYLYVEGYLWDYIAKNRHHYNNSTINQVEGALSHIRQLTQVVECLNQTHCFNRMYQDFKRATDGKNRQLTKINKHYDNLVSFLSSGKDSIGVMTAENIVYELELKCLDDLFNLNMDKLLLVDGVGQTRAESVLTKVYGKNWLEKSI